MALKLKGSTSGFVAIDAPSVAGNNTLILPENSGSAFQIFANDITAGVTTFTQVTVSRNGDLTVPGTISIGGTLTYEDVTSVDSVGIVTARGLSIFGNTTGLNVASGISTFQAVTGTTGTFSGDISISNDTGRINLGASADLKLYHDGNNSKIVHNGGGNFIIEAAGSDEDVTIQATDDVFIKVQGSENSIRCLGDAAVELYHNGTKKVETASYGVLSAAQVRVASSNASTVAFSVGDVGTGFYNTGSNMIGYSANGTQKWNINSAGTLNLKDDVNLTFGDGNDFLLYHDGSTNYIKSDNGNVAIRVASGNRLEINGTTGNVTMQGSSGKNFTWSNSTAYLNLNDNAKLTLGTSDDLAIYHNGNDSYIDDSGTGALVIKTSLLSVRNAADSEQLAKFTQDGACELYFNNAKKLKTINEGIKLTELQIAPSGTETSSLMTFGGGGVVTNSNSYGHFYDRGTSGSNTTAIMFRTNGSSVGTINFNNSITMYNTSSDYRLKENEVSISDGITRLKTLKPYRFNFKGESATVDGFFAHEVTAVPEAISGTKDEVDSDDNPVYQGIDQSKLVPLLTAALQEAVAKIETLEAKVAALEGS